MRLYAKLYIGFILASGFVCFAYAMAGWRCAEPFHFICQLAIALLAAALKVSLPGISGTMSVSYVFVLLSMMDFSYPETMLVACLAILMQSVSSFKRPVRLVRLAFNWAALAIAVSVGYGIYHLATARLQSLLLSVALAATGYFVSNTVSIATVIALTESKKLHKVWRECYFWSFPYYLVGAAIAALISVCNHRLGWQAVFLTLPVVYVIFRSYRLYLGRLESEKLHAEEIAALHLRTIEALALAIEAKDETTHEHLQRVQVYAVELGRKINLDENELQALRAASILHDIGKLAVPEHIISKPGKLTPEEFEKMKIHPIVGAEILARVQFPYGVVPIVRAHHERWDGSGYPHGLAGEEIPEAAQITAVADAFDAMTNDRPYRSGRPIAEAVAEIVACSGTQFSPRVVDALVRVWEHDEIPFFDEIDGGAADARAA